MLPTAEAVRRARRTGGTSDHAIYRTVAFALAARGCGGTLVDVGAGGGTLWRHVDGRFSRYVGVDVVSYSGFPSRGAFVVANLDAGGIPLASASADVVAAVEVIEHLENPRALVRELVRIVRPGGWVAITTPNQRSALSVLTLVFRGRFAAFQDCDYPAHLTALLDIDLVRIAGECGLRDVEVCFTAAGRVPLTSGRYPAWLSRRWPTAFSDNVLLVGRAP